MVTKKKTRKYLMEVLISFETAKLAKSKGFIFDGHTNNWLETTLPYREDGSRTIDFTYKGEYYGAPTQSLLQKWLRDKYNIHVEVNYRRFGVPSGNGYFYMCNLTKYVTMDEYFGKDIFHGFETYEEALEVGLQSGLKMIKKDNQRNEARR